MTDAPDDQSHRAWPGPVLPPDEDGLARLARREAAFDAKVARWHLWTRSGADGMGGLCEDPGEPWRAGE